MVVGEVVVVVGEVVVVVEEVVVVVVEVVVVGSESPGVVVILTIGVLDQVVVGP